MSAMSLFRAQIAKFFIAILFITKTPRPLSCFFSDHLGRYPEIKLEACSTSTGQSAFRIALLARLTASLTRTSEPNFLMPPRAFFIRLGFGFSDSACSFRESRSSLTSSIVSCGTSVKELSSGNILSISATKSDA